MSGEPSPTQFDTETLSPVDGRAVRLILVRHADHQSQPSENPDLSELGVWQARRLADRLAATGEAAAGPALYVSTLARARTTAAILAPVLGGAVRAVVDQRLNELELGVPGMPLEVVASRLTGRSPKRRRVAESGESWQDFEDRARSALRQYAAQEGTSLLVCHTGVIELSFIEFAGLTRRAQRFAMSPRNTSVTSWVRLNGGERWRLECYNDVQHLWRGGVLYHRRESFEAHEPLWAALEPE